MKDFLEFSCSCKGKEFLWDETLGEIVCTNCGSVIIQGKEEALYRRALESGSLWQKEVVLHWKN